MKKTRLLIIISLFLILTGYGQTNSNLPHPKYPELFKTIPLVSESDPDWVHLMYSEFPNFYKTEKSYLEYYREHVYTKTTHTQNFKHFSRLIYGNDFLKQNGDVYIPTLKEEKEHELLMKHKREKNKTINSANWMPIGPFETFAQGGLDYKASQINVYTIDQSISNPNILFAGGETGPLFKTTDKGVNWFPIAETISLKAGGAIKIDPENADIVFVSDGNNKLWKTIDGGNTWQIVHEVYNLKITDISINGLVILTAGNKGLYRSDNGGLSWTHVFADKCWDIELKTDNPTTVFIAKSNPTINRTEIWKSTDGGVTFNAKLIGWWNPIGGHAASDGGARIGVTDADPNRIYVVLLGDENDSNNDSNYIGIYKSINAGESWTLPYDGNNNGMPDNEPGGPYSSQHWCLSTFTPSSNGGYNQGYYDLALDVSDTDPDKFLVGFLNLFKSEDGGVSYTEWGGYVCNSCGSGYRHPDIQEIEINGNDVWVTSDGGVDYYDVNLNYQETRIKGLSGVNFWGIDQGWNEDVLVGGRYHNGNTAYYQNYGVGKFLSLGGGEAPTGYVNKAENRKTHFSDISDKEIPEELTGEIHDISNFQLYPNQHYYATGKSEIVTHPLYWNQLYLGKDNKLWKSENGGASFDLVKAFGINESFIVKGIEISRNNPNVIYLIHDLELWKSSDAGETWVELTIPSLSNNMQISVSETNENDLFLSFAHGGSYTDKVYVTHNGGLSWINLTTSTLNGEKINNIKTQAGTNGGVYIATSDNVYYRNATHSDWQIFTAGLPWERQPLKLMPFYKNGKIRYATFNRGVYESDFYESSNPIAQPMVKNKFQHCANRGVQFEDFSILKHEGATWEWEFPGATTVSSTSVRNPVVTYETEGTYDVKLTVTDGMGLSDTKTIENMIIVGEDYCYPDPNPQNALYCSSDYDYASNTSINLTDITNFTFTAWVKPEGIQADYSGLFSLGSGVGDNKNVLNFREGNNTIGMHWNGIYWSWDSNIIVPPDEWSYVAISVSPTQIKLLVNEELKTWNVFTSPIDINRILIGTYYQWGSRNYKGLIDEATFWKRTLSEEEIRLARHLTKQDMSDSDMIAYYQFNHDVSAKVYDKKNTYDLDLSNNANLVISSAPIGIGNSQIIDITTSGVTDFSGSNVAIDFATGVLPNGDVVVSKLEVSPNNTPDISEISKTYWVINNYGDNTVFEPLNSIVFTQTGNLNSAVLSDLKLYKRTSNSDIETDWEENATATSFDPITESIVFPGSSISSFSQFYLGSLSPLYNDNYSQESIQTKVYPNPIINGNTLRIDSIKEVLFFVLYDSSGKEIYKSKLSLGKTIQIQNLTQGIYYYGIETVDKMYSGQLIVE